MVWWLILNFWSMRCVGLGSVTYIFTRERETYGTSFGRLSSRWKHHMMSTLKQERMAMLDMSWGQFCLQIEKLSTWPQFWTFSSSSQRRSEAPDLINTVMFVANLKKMEISVYRTCTIPPLVLSSCFVFFCDGSCISIQPILRSWHFGCPHNTSSLARSSLQCASLLWLLY